MIMIFALLSLFCILFSVAVVFNVAGLPMHLWMSVKLGWFGKWIPHDLGLMKDATLSRWHSGFLELMILLLLFFVIYILCIMYIYHMEANKYPTLKRIIWLVPVLGGCIYLFTPGMLVSDVYSYASYGRILAIHESNPYFVPPSAFPADPIYPLLFWKNATSTYGPIWTVISALLSLLAGAHPLRILLIFRLFAFVMHLLNIALVGVTLQEITANDRRLVVLGMVIYGWNPLVLMESCLGGHNDVLLVTFILLGFYFYARIENKKNLGFSAYLPPLIAFTLAALVKYSAIPVIAIFSVVIFKRIFDGKNGRDGIGSLPGKKLGRSSALRHPLIRASISVLGVWGVSLLLAFICYLPFWLGHPVSEILHSFVSLPAAQQVFNSLLFAIESYNRAHLLPSSLQFLGERGLWSALMILAMLVPLILGMLALWQAPTARTMALVALAALSGSLLFTPWFFPWYVTWLIGLAAICPPARHDRLARALVAFALTFSLTAFAAYYSTLIGWSLLDAHPVQVAWTLWMCAITFGVPLLVGIWGLV